MNYAAGPTVARVDPRHQCPAPGIQTIIPAPSRTLAAFSAAHVALLRGRPAALRAHTWIAGLIRPIPGAGH